MIAKKKTKMKTIYRSDSNNLLALVDRVIHDLFIFDEWRRKMSNIENHKGSEISVHVDQVHFLMKFCSKFNKDIFEHFKSPWSI